MHENVRTILMLSLVLFVFFAPFLLGAWVLYPLDRAARYWQRPIQFTTMDFLGLVFIIQLPMGLVHLLLPQDPSLRVTLGVVGAIMSALIWFAGVRMLSRAGITDATNRAKLVFFVLPLAYFGPLIAVVLPVANIDPERLSRASNLPVVLAELAIVVTLVFAGRLSRRIASTVSGWGRTQ